MNVSLKNIDELNAVLTVEINEADFASKVETALTNYRKNANLPGFRKGKAPEGLIRKQYQKPLKIDEVNKILQDSVYEFLTKEKLDILGNPLPVVQTDIDWDKQTDFSFDFELGLSPKIDVSIPKSASLTYMNVIADDQMIDGYIADLAGRYGKMSKPEVAKEDDMFFGEFQELEADGNPKLGGIVKVANITGTTVVNEDIRAKLVALKEGAHIVINTKSDLKEGFNFAGLVGSTTAKLNETSGLFNFTLKNVSRLEPHPIDQELFDRALGADKVDSLEAFKDVLRKEAENSFVGQADNAFFHNAYHWFLENVKFDLPEAFLKKWLRTAGEKPMTAEQVEAEFENTLNGMRWQMIENRLIRENNLSVTQDELRDYTKGLVANQFAQYGQTMTDEELEKFADNYLEKREEAQQLNDQVYNQKLTQFFKDSFAINYKDVTIAEFAKHQAEHQH